MRAVAAGQATAGRRPWGRDSHRLASLPFPAAGRRRLALPVPSPGSNVPRSPQPTATHRPPQSRSPQGRSSQVSCSRGGSNSKSPRHAPAPRCWQPAQPEDSTYPETLCDFCPKLKT